MNVISHPWEQQPEETHKSWMAFCTYRDLGFYRSYEKARIKLGKNQYYLKWLQQWSARFDWVVRARAYDVYLEKKAREAFEESLLKEQLELKKDELKTTKALFRFANRVIAEANASTIVDEEGNSTVFINSLAAKMAYLTEVASRVRRRALNMPLEPQSTEGEKGQLESIAEALNNAD